MAYEHTKFQKGATLTEWLVIVPEAHENSGQMWMCFIKPGRINGVKLLWQINDNPESEIRKEMSRINSATTETIT